MTFVDASFPTSRKSLYFTAPRDADDPIQSWKRPRDFCKQKPLALFLDGVAAGDVQQGMLGDCWFLGALSVVAMRSELLEHLFVASDAESGKYVIRFFKEGAWTEVTVDDQVNERARRRFFQLARRAQLPCTKAGTPAYGHCHQENELWVPLVEKAYAKLHGSFQALEGGSISEGLVDL